ncbi:MAG: hypothetical protein IKM35_00875 [Bacteroidaceae bacterium]|nr:hypothetical protein [Bacteroidaceae bacterium]
MSQNNDCFSFDDDQAVEFIRPRLPQEIQDKYSDNEIIYIGDIVYDFYEKKGFFEDNNNDDVDLDVDELIDFVRQCLRKDKDAQYAEEDIEYLVRGELDYEEHLGMWEA